MISILFSKTKKMNLHLISTFLIFMNTWIAVGSSPSQFIGDFSINCGSSDTSKATSDGREWHGDLQPRFSSFLQIKGSSTSSTIVYKPVASADDLVPPYNTARLSRYQFSYGFRVNPGQKILRLHFNPSLYKGYKSCKDLFSVDAGHFTLLTNFSASLTARALGVTSFVKEYCVNIPDVHLFNIVFTPTSNQLFETFAFINGIQIIALPAGLTYFHGPDQVGLPVVGKSPIYVDDSTALEIIRRLKLKHDLASSSGDGGYTFGMWEAVPKQKQKKQSEIKNITWTTSVDVGFRYLVRLYFSELLLKLEESGSAVVFKVRINEMPVDTSIHVLGERGNEDSRISRYVDYMVLMRGRKQEGRRDLVIWIESNVDFTDENRAFKGFEIMKLSNLEYSLASLDPPLSSVQDSSHGTLQNLQIFVGGKNMIATIAITFLVAANIIFYTLSQIWGVNARGAEEENLLSEKAIQLCRRFSLSEIQSATKNFSEAYIIGKGGFGKVYKALIDDGHETVAIKRLKPNARQGAREFRTEIETLIELRHVNIVSLIGYCNEHGEMIIVYEYMANGTLADHLYKLARKSDNVPYMHWKERISICIGAAQGLEYLHSGQILIHRDIKASNILLDKDFSAKVSDFGLAKYLNRRKSESHVSTKIKGTLGYLDPSYFSTGKLTRKSDIYAFGVVLLEVLCGRSAVDRLYIGDDQILTKWALQNISKGRVHQIVDSDIVGEIMEDSLESFVELATRCLLDEPKKRPRMAQVVTQLEIALEQQERATPSLVQDGVTSDLDHIHPSDEANINNKVEYIEPPSTSNPANDETNLSSSIGPAMTASTDVQDVTPPRVVQMGSRKGGRKSTTNKPSLFGSLGGFWNKIKPSSKNKQSVIGNQAVETVKKSDQSVGLLPITVPAIPLDVMKNITGNFSLKCLIGKGFRGEVFRTILETGQAAAIKKLDYSEQDQESSLVSVLSKLKHENVVQLLGYCTDGDEQILAYEFAPHGSIHDILHAKASSEIRRRMQVLSWTQRVQLLIGAAKGLEYIHSMTQIHHNIKSTNILVFGNYDVAKVTDLRLSNPRSDMTECLSIVAGTLGYQAPEYFMIGEVSWRSDVYNFGVVLMELLTGHQPIDSSLPRGKQHLVSWATPKLTTTKVYEVVDARLEGNYPRKAVAKMAAIAASCVQFEPDSRPTMSVVVKELQSLLAA
ncbi:putative receptor-like protein kinase At5g39000 [Salvia splendens]|uniref:putative receptor-like protein kinase At5g39000 n=1 Tax=Salvia splendens TaxID=180675 RepID=UPI001C276BED|nr:putative receptor-like protein kinase At5g39000 [Salvia splendens]